MRLKDHQKKSLEYLHFFYEPIYSALPLKLQSVYPKDYSMLINLLYKKFFLYYVTKNLALHSDLLLIRSTVICHFQPVLFKIRATLSKSVWSLQILITNSTYKIIRTISNIDKKYIGNKSK